MHPLSILLGLLPLMLPATALAQTPSIWIGNSNGLILSQQSRFNALTGELELPLVQVRGGPDHDQLLINVTLKLRDDERFSLEDYHVLPRPVSCAEDDIAAALPQLTLDQSLTEIESLLGCPGRLGSLSTDLQTGRTAVMRFSESDALRSINPPLPYNVFTAIDASTGQLLNALELSSFYNPFVFASPSLEVTFLEGQVQEYYYRAFGATSLSFCDQDALLTGFDKLVFTDSPSAISALFDCESNLDGVRLDEDGEQREFSWRSNPRAVDFISGNADSGNGYTAITGTFRDNVPLSMSRYTHQPSLPTEICSVAELLAAAETLIAGMDRAGAIATVGCDYSLSNTTQELGGDSEEDISWVTDIPNDDRLLSPNRRLQLQLRNGVVDAVYLTRF